MRRPTPGPVSTNRDTLTLAEAPRRPTSAPSWKTRRGLLPALPVREVPRRVSRLTCGDTVTPGRSGSLALQGRRLTRPSGAMADRPPPPTLEGRAPAMGVRRLLVQARLDLVSVSGKSAQRTSEPQPWPAWSLESRWRLVRVGQEGPEPLGCRFCVLPLKAPGNEARTQRRQRQEEP